MGSGATKKDGDKPVATPSAIVMAMRSFDDSDASADDTFEKLADCGTKMVA